MERPRHKLEGDPSVFVRFRNGFRLYIKNNIREIIQTLIPKMSTSVDLSQLFRYEIKDIADGSGLGIHPDSTWPALIREIVENYERDGNKLDVKNKIIVLELFQLITDARSIEEKWEDIKLLILSNVEDFSSWTSAKKYKGSSFFGDVKRDVDGNYYLIENGHRIGVMGTVKTTEEERFDFITNDILHTYGKINGFIKLIALIEIGDKYKNHPEYFSSRKICNLPDNDHESAYLHWQWYVWGAFDFVPVFWKPRSCFSDPEWLASDLMSTFSENLEIHKEFPPKLTDPTDFQKFQEAFNDYSLQYELALDTDLYLGDETEVYFNFLGRQLRWINGNRFVTPVISIPSNDPNYADAMEIAKKFISIMVKEAHISISEIFSAGTAKKFNPLIRQPRTIGGLGLDPRYILPSNIGTYSERKWIGLALYREGVNSKSIYYSFLSYYKVVQLAFEKPNHKEDEEAARKWITANIEKVGTSVSANWKTELGSSNMEAGVYLYASRNIATHIISEKNKINNPDEIVNYTRIQRDIPVIRALANEIFQQNLL